jgi:hypothetical protein
MPLSSRYAFPVMVLVALVFATFGIATAQSHPVLGAAT